MTTSNTDTESAQAPTVQTPTARARAAAEAARLAAEHQGSEAPASGAAAGGAGAVGGVSPDAVTQQLPLQKQLRQEPAAPPAEPVNVPSQGPKPKPAARGPLQSELAVPMRSEIGRLLAPGPEAPPAPPRPARPEPPAPDQDPQAGSTRHTVNWKQSIPYDDTGVLIRPAGWTDDQLETVLIDVLALRGMKKQPKGAATDPEAQRRPLLRRLLRIPRPRHGVLMAIMALQAALSLRNRNTAFMDEALYLYSGHLELGHLVLGAPLYDNFVTYFSGSPVLYPVIGALADQVGGVFAARLLSLLFMLGATGMLYLTTRRMFGVRAGLFAAALFGTTESVAFVGGLATYDAPAVFLLALAMWIVVRSGRSAWPFYQLAVIPLILAVGTKYAALLFVPTVLVLAGISTLVQSGRWWALLRPAALGLTFGAMVYGLIRLAGPGYAAGISSTTTARAQGSTPTGQILREVAQWGGVMFAVALFGAVVYVVRPKFALDAGEQPGRIGRAALGCVLVGTALLAPADQLHLHTDVSLYKHVGFGLLFAAPLAGYGMQRLIGAHYQRVQFGIALWAVALALTVTQTTSLFHAWAPSTKLVSTLRKYTEPRGEYLVENSPPVIYGLRDDVNAEPYQIISTYSWQFTDLEGRSYTGTPAYTTAIRDDFFNVVAFDGGATPDVDAQILNALKANHDYYLTTTITQQSSYGWDTYYIWVKWEPWRK